MASYGYEPGIVDRSVSPLGASRFEQDWIPGIPEQPSISNISSTSSPTSVQRSPATSASSREPYRSHATKPSVVSTNGTTTTPATSITYPRPSTGKASTPTELQDADADDWFIRCQCDPDLPIDDTDECPDGATLAAVYDIPVYDAEGTPRSFGSLYDPTYTPHQRQLVIFVRHFYCGACQAYLQALTDGITMREYFSIPTPTSIIVIGCGQPEIIKHYKTFTNNCPFPIFADPSRQLFKKLGMHTSLNIGRSRPEYMKDVSPLAWMKGQNETIKKSLRDPEGIRKRDVLRGGNPMQIGGEFLFDEGQVVWCHRMRNYRNHAEVAVLRRLLEIDE